MSPFGYALSIGESTVIKYEIGEGLIGQSAASGNTLYVDDVPDGYIKIVSGLGSASPQHLLIVPVKKNKLQDTIYLFVGDQRNNKNTPWSLITKYTGCNCYIFIRDLCPEYGILFGGGLANQSFSELELGF